MSARPLVWLLAADTLFLWMFLSADPLERMALDGSWPADSAIVRHSAFRFAADWRHGMAGNSPLYMPGFFALAAAAWIWASGRSLRRLIIEGALALMIALALAWVMAPAGAAFVVRGFANLLAADAPVALPAPGWRATVAGVYTAITWTAFVAGCRLALERHSWWPLAPVPMMTVLLVFARPWTVGDFSGLWLSRALSGNPVALGSLVAVPMTGWLLLVFQGRLNATTPPSDSRGRQMIHALRQRARRPTSARWRGTRANHQRKRPQG